MGAQLSDGNENLPTATLLISNYTRGGWSTAGKIVYKPNGIQTTPFTFDEANIAGATLFARFLCRLCHSIRYGSSCRRLDKALSVGTLSRHPRISTFQLKRRKWIVEFRRGSKDSLKLNEPNGIQVHLEQKISRSKEAVEIICYSVALKLFCIKYTVFIIRTLLFILHFSSHQYDLQLLSINALHVKMN